MRAAPTVAVAVLLGVGCASRQFPRRTEEVLVQGSPRGVVAAGGEAAIPLRAGQWLLFRGQALESSGGRPVVSWERLTLEAVDGSRVDLRLEDQSGDDWSLARASLDLGEREKAGQIEIYGPDGTVARTEPIPRLLRFLPRSRHRYSAAECMGVVCMDIVAGCGHSGESYVFRGHLPARTEDPPRDLLLRAAALELPRLLGGVWAPREDLGLPAGTFSGAIRLHLDVRRNEKVRALLGHAPVPRSTAPDPVTVWLHPAVPLGGLIKLEDGRGDRLELLDFGS